jgi:thymidylate synthase
MKTNIEHQYLKLLKDILDNGVEKQDRTGTGTHSVFGRQIRHSMSEGFPLLTTKKMAFKTMVTELLWFLKGDTNIKYLVDNGCNIWNGDAYKNWVLKNSEPDQYWLTQEEFINKIKTDDDFVKQWGELGPIYGKQWRRWVKKKMYLSTDGSYENIYDEADQTIIDQIQILINELKNNPDSRRLMVSAWNVGELDQMVLPPCHYGFQVYTRKLSLQERREWCKDNGVVLEHLEAGLENEEDDMRGCGVPTRAISLMWNQRSVDTFLGLPFNIASYGLLLEIIAKEVNMIPDELIGNLGDVHLYSNHIEQAKEQLTREPMKLPKLNELPNYLCMKDDWECYKPSDFTLDNYQSHPTIKAPLSN